MLKAKIWRWTENRPGFTGFISLIWTGLPGHAPVRTLFAWQSLQSRARMRTHTRNIPEDGAVTICHVDLSEHGMSPYRLWASLISALCWRRNAGVCLSSKETPTVTRGEQKQHQRL